MKYLSTFSGIGGFEIGIHNAYRSTLARKETPQEDWYSTEGFDDARATQGFSGEHTDPNVRSEEPTCVGYSEIDKFASAVYQQRFGGINYGDITKINAEELPDFDCLVGGFPCQAFSIAGKRGGFEDTRGTLFFDLARILRAKRPRLFVFENVKGLLSHDNGNTFRTIIATIDELGYNAQWQVVNSKNHGVPQNRERIIIVGNLRGTPRFQIFPLGSSAENNPKSDSTEEGSVAGTLTARQFANWSGNHIAQLNQPIHSNDRIYSPEGIAPTLNTMQGGRRQPLVALSRDEAGDNSPVDSAGVREASRVPRQLDGVSDTQRYKMAGNAVTTNVIQSVFERIFEHEWGIR